MTAAGLHPGGSDPAEQAPRKLWTKAEWTREKAPCYCCFLGHSWLDAPYSLRKHTQWLRGSRKQGREENCSHSCCTVAECCAVLSRSLVSDPLRPCGLQPAGLLCPWDSPGKSTGVGFHALLQGIFPTQGSNQGLPHCRGILYFGLHRWMKGDVTAVE